MSRNIKEIGKELLGKSLNSFHRKTGLTQLEKNNEMQDGILDGILSQVDDAYIEKTEQSNVIHLEGSGDGVVVVDSIEGNTMVNMLGLPTSTTNSHVGTYNIRKNGFTITFNAQVGNKTNIYFSNSLIEVNKGYTLFMNITKNTLIKENANTSSYNVSKFNFVSYNKGVYTIKNGETGMVRVYLQQPATTTHNGIPYLECYDDCAGELVVENAFMIEGNWTNREMPPYFEGLQSSFEEKANDEDKYEIEILSKNKNLYNVEDVNIGSWMNSGGATVSKINNNIVLNGTISDYFDFRTVQSSWNANLTKLINKLPVGTTLTMSNNLTSEKNTINYWSVRRDGAIKYFTNTLTIQKGDTEIGGFVRFRNGTVLNNTILKVQIEVNNKATNYTISKQNKIKLLLNEPLRGLPNGTKDKLCIKDDKLVIKRKCGETTLNDMNIGYTNGTYLDIFNLGAIGDKYNVKTQSYMTCDKFPYVGDVWNGCQAIGIGGHNGINFRITYPKETMTVDSLTQWLQNNQTTVVYELAEPTYEEVLNEYGEPILLEGYENGTLYIDSTIVPTTTVRYTPKMESFKTLNEVSDNNTMLTNDINDNIIPYMMDVDFIIMEKEMALPSKANIRTMEVLDMTSMQKRTQDMLERLIKGKSLTEQECKTRVAVYLNAGKITDEQAKELNFLIDEIYA